MTENTRGILAMIAANAAFLANDTLMKLAMEKIPVGQSIFVRGVLTAGVFFAIYRFQGASIDLGSLKSPLIGWRIVAEVLASVAYLVALMGMPIADLGGLLQLVPLALMAAAALFLGETIGWRRWTAAAMGLSGALLIVNPAIGISSYQAVALFCIVAIVARDILTRSLPREISSLAVSVTSSAALTVAGLAMGLGETWLRPDFATTTYLVAAAAFLVGANTWLVVAMRTGEIGVVGPFRYTSLIWAILCGFVVWGEIPDTRKWLGMALLVAAGLYSLHRQRVRQRPDEANPSSRAAAGE